MSLCGMRELIRKNLNFDVTLVSMCRGELNGYNLVNNKGYIVELDYFDEGVQLLFIADEEDYNWLHEAGSVFVNKTFNNRCRWVTMSQLKFNRVVGLFI